MKTSKLESVDINGLFRAPRGFKLKTFVAFTYSLHGRFLSDYVLSELAGERAEDWLDRDSNYSRVFLQSEHIVGGSLPTSLLGLLVPVRTGKYSSFHPKMYFMQFSDGDKRLSSRVIVGSFNLTLDGFGRNFEFFVKMEGVQKIGVSAKGTANGQREMLRYVSKIAQTVDSLEELEAKSLLNKLRSIIYGVSWPTDAEFVGDSPGKHGAITETMKGKRRIIVSPFWDKEAVGMVTAQAEQIDIFGPVSANNAAPFPADDIGGKVKFFQYQSAGGEKEVGRATLHGKMFFSSGRGDVGKLYIGSGNCTNRYMKAGANYEAGLMLSYDETSLRQFLARHFTQFEPESDLPFTHDAEEGHDNEILRSLVAGMTAAGDSVWVTATDLKMLDGHVVRIGAQVFGRDFKKFPHELKLANGVVAASVSVTVDGREYQLIVDRIFDPETGKSSPATYSHWQQLKRHLAAQKCSSLEQLFDLYSGDLTPEQVIEMSQGADFNGVWRERKFPFQKMMAVLWQSDGEKSGDTKLEKFTRTVSFLERVISFNAESRGRLFIDFGDQRDLLARDIYGYWAESLQRQCGKLPSGRGDLKRRTEATTKALKKLAG